MNVLEARALRDRAAAKTHERLRADAARASHRIRPLVEHVERNLFEPDLDFQRMREALSIRDNNRSTLFRRELGLTPAAYVRDCRLELACRLLRDTALGVAWVAELVGYGGPQVFTPAFKRYAGMTPTAYRRQERRAAAAAVPALSAPLPDSSPSGWRRFVLGEATVEDATFLLRNALERYPWIRRQLLAELLTQLARGVEGARAPHAGLPDEEGDERLLPPLRRWLSGADVEALMAEELWERIRGWPRADQLAVVRQRFFATPSLLFLLGTRSEEEAERDPEAGLAIARLALEHAATLDDGGREDGVSTWRAMGWAWIAHAKRMARDEPGAARAFAAGRRQLPEGDEMRSRGH